MILHACLLALPAERWVYSRGRRTPQPHSGSTATREKERSSRLTSKRFLQWAVLTPRMVVMMIETIIVPTSMSTLSILSLSNTICNNADHMQWMASPPGSAVEISEGEAEEGAFKARAEESHRGIPPRADDTPATRSPSAGSEGSFWWRGLGLGG